MKDFKPNIVVIACHWCTYAGADLAGSLRYRYPANVCLVRVPCSGRVEPEFIFHAFFSGADGVLIGGCHPGDCHYKYGNYYAHRRFNLLQRFLELLGISKERIRLEWISGAEGLKFAQVAKEFTEKIKNLGPANIKKPENLNWKELCRVISACASTGKVFWDEPKCIVDFILFFLDYVQRNSCGKCVPCRIGTKRLNTFLEYYLNNGRSNSKKFLIDLLAEDIGASSRCDLGRLAGKILKYALNYCKEDFEAHKTGNCNKNIPANPGWENIVVK